MTLTYRVEELAASCDVAVDTVRYYQGLGLIDPPQRVGRTAVYGDEHARQLRLVRRLADSGFTLAQIKQLGGSDDRLLQALLERMTGSVLLTRDQLAQAAGVEPELIGLAVAAGLLRPVGTDAAARFPSSAVSMLQAAGTILASGVPLDRLVTLAAEHASGVSTVVDEAIELFRDFVRPATDTEALTEMVRVLLAQTTRLVAEHFHRTLVSRAIERLEATEDTDLVAALVGAEPDTMVVSCEWP